MHPIMATMSLFALDDELLRPNKKKLPPVHRRRIVASIGTYTVNLCAVGK